jgi:hypothetical protein
MGILLGCAGSYKWMICVYYTTVVIGVISQLMGVQITGVYPFVTSTAPPERHIQVDDL